MYWHIADMPAVQRLEPDEQKRIAKLYSRRAQKATGWRHFLLYFGASFCGIAAIQMLGISQSFWTSMLVMIPCGLIAVCLYQPFLLRRMNDLILRDNPNLCRTCGYDLRATPARCPECGTVPKKPVEAKA